MRILLVTDGYPPTIGGANRSTQLLAQALARRGDEVVVAAAYQPGLAAVALDGSVVVHRIRDSTSRVPGISQDPHNHTPPPWPDPEATWRLRRLVRAFRPDAAGLYGWLSYSCAAALRGRGVPVVLSLRDYGNICAVRTLVRRGRQCDGPAPAKCVACAGAFYGRTKGTAAAAGVLGGRRALTRDLRVAHSVSRYVRSVTHQHLIAPGRGLARAPEEVVVPDFTDPAPASAPDPEILAMLPPDPFILFVGQLRRVKGLEALFAAHRRLTDPPSLVLMGSPAPDTPAIPPGVTVLRSVPHATVLAAWSRALFGVFPSLQAEPLGNVVHEAMSAGRAVIGTRPGGHEDLVADGHTGLLVGAGDVDALRAAMDRLIDDVPLRERLGDAGRIAARALEADRVVPRLLAMFDRAVALGSGA